MKPGAGHQRTDRRDSVSVRRDTDTFSPEIFGELFRREAGHFWFRSRNQLLIDSLRQFFPGAKSLLEIGCGTGFVLSGLQGAFPHLQLYGGEFLREGLAFAGKRLRGAGLIQMDARCLPFKQRFDVVGAFDVLEHIREDETVLSQMFGAVRPGGGILLTVPQHRFLWSVADRRAFHKRRYTRRDIVEKVERAGFLVIRTTSFVSILLPLLLLSRLSQNIWPDHIDALREFDIGKLPDAGLNKVMDLERIMIGRGVSFPFGGSLLLIAIRG